ncbi:acyltransferase family protein [Trujillonella endophytica]|uniref:Peptidoglycan/LPS O-acetylase OafA/YrhL, contains acyltransferase and SGNH-hydrolase domains n=1 Tax=Trujillonella endophytica TaxID=673521 RepID=A0A1H8W5C5_9ACTN|nr:acyltransferase family protein [Trujillella endophytica]SEP22647.1 Peptidoglycan/LPS O-acetylase OafA/YrhL, contains acyltransferase and SGNH-hydrolase domains [Trujillella endophytica]
MATDTRAALPAAVPSGPPASALPRDGASHVRGDIEGLRAVAVLLVIGDHLLGWPHGGFVGVDVFFVISGFLITGLLLREHRTSGRISFVDFYKRRIRRILPASLLVLVATVVAAHAVFFGSRARTTSDDALWSLLFAGNWRFALNGTDYLQAGGPLSPLQHYWSLAVEEQFYVVWPVVLAVVLGIAGWRRKHGPKGLVGIAVVAVGVVVGGYAWALHETTTDPTWAYFSTFSRAWELGLGALLAVAVPAVARIPARLRPLLGWVGLAGIVASAFVIGPDTPFPAPGALLPVLSTGLVIAAGTGGPSHVLALDNPLARYLGALSYSLYLWHFPAIVVLAVLLPVDGTYYALVAALTVVVSMASYHLVEQPIRRSDWLRPGVVRKRERRVALIGGWVATAAAAALTVVLVVLPATGSGWPWASASEPAAAPPPVSVDDPLPAAPSVDHAAVLAGEISAAVTTPEWPELVPGLDSTSEEVYVPEWVVDDCLNIRSAADAAGCVYGDPAAERTAVLLGDSVSISWMPGIRRALESDGWQIRVLTLGQCPQAMVPTEMDRGDPAFPEYCSAHQEWALAQVQELRPDLVIMSSAANSIGRMVSEAEGDAALAEWRDGLIATMTALDGLQARFVLLGSPPPGLNIQTCATRFNTPQDCLSTIADDVTDFLENEADTVRAFRGTTLQASYVDTRSWFCDAQEQCPLFVGTTPVFADGTHMTAAYSARLAPVLAPVLAG